MNSLSQSNPDSILIVEDQFIEAHDLELILERNGYAVCGIARSVPQAQESISQYKPGLVLLDIFLKGTETGIELAGKLKEQGIGFIFISANSGKKILDQVKVTEPYGFVVKPFREQDVITIVEIAFYRKRHSQESRLMQQYTLGNKIRELAAPGAVCKNAFEEIGKLLQTHIGFDFLEFLPIPGNLQVCRPKGLLRRFDGYDLTAPKKNIAGKEAGYFAKFAQHPEIFTGQKLVSLAHGSPHCMDIASRYGIRSILLFPLKLQDAQAFLLFCSRQEPGYSGTHAELLLGIRKDVEHFFTQSDHCTETVSPKRKEKSVNELFPGMVGRSTKMLEVLDYVQRVAPSDTSVLILGESGTGKEKVARSIHELSLRNGKPLVTVNCAAIPENLAESLLFGHEKGAFTGAVDARIGKFEQANGGTIFLDEIGEMPLEMQVKLLRVLQEREIERVGGRNPIKLDVRIIAATNRNLEEEVAGGRFRLDLYYRLHIFPITVPALRERREDIPDLIAHFTAAYSQKPVSFSPQALKLFTQHHWPGNVRELEHCVQRHILMATSDVIRDVRLPQFPAGAKPEQTGTKTIHENERDYIIAILEKCNGKVSGIGGAAEILNIPASTLNSKMKKLGIRYQH